MLFEIALSIADDLSMWHAMEFDALRLELELDRFDRLAMG